MLPKPLKQEGAGENRRIKKPLPPSLRLLHDYGLVFLGAFLIAVSFNVFLNHFRIASGGVSGVSIIIHALFGIRPAYTQWALNLPLFILGTIALGRGFALKTFVGTMVLPLFVYWTEGAPSITTSPLVASIFGGIGVGLGLGLVFRGHGSTGGTDLLAQVLTRLTGLPLSTTVRLLDGLVITWAAFVFDMEQALYALIGLYLTGRTIDFVMLGTRRSLVAYIITEQEEAVRSAILYDLDRGLTRIEAIGGYSNLPRPMLMSVVDQREVQRLKDAVQAIDPQAFVIVLPAAEVLGEGFHRMSP
ncbi:MAG: YitT family protein [Candidatus Carbobacillus altaicus]|nr:YitT family protein [Candidatus Carbobacillus altaicus]